MSRVLLGVAVIVVLLASVTVEAQQRAGALLNEYTDRLQKENAIDAALTQKALTDLQIAKNASSAHLLSVEQAKAAEEMARSELFDAEGDLKACQDQNIESKARDRTKAVVQKISAMLEEIENPALPEAQRKTVLTDLQPLVESDPRLSKVVDVQKVMKSGSPTTSAIAQLIAQVLKILDNESSEAAAKCSHVVHLIEAPEGLRAKLMIKMRAHRDAVSARRTLKNKVDQLTIAYTDLKLKQEANKARRQETLTKISTTSGTGVDVTGELMKTLKQERERGTNDRRVLHARAASADKKRWTELQKLNEAIAKAAETETAVEKAKAAVRAEEDTCAKKQTKTEEELRLLNEMKRLAAGMNARKPAVADVQMPNSQAVSVKDKDTPGTDDSIQKAEAQIEHDLMSISFLQVGEAVVRPHDEAAEIETALDELIQVVKNETTSCASLVKQLKAAEGTAMKALDEAQMHRSECKRAEQDAEEAVKAAEGAAKAVAAESLAEESERIQESVLLGQVHTSI